MAQAPALNYRVIMQAETENAGFYADKLEKVLHTLKLFESSKEF